MNQLFLIAGPCVIESEEHTLMMARALDRIARAAGVRLFFKASFDKANRTSIESYRGPGIDQGLEILRHVKAETGLPVLTDIHEPWQAARTAEVCEVLQIPAFLCRQTDLLVAAARTGATVNVKKGQFVSPWDMQHAIEKIRSAQSESDGSAASLERRRLACPGSAPMTGTGHRRVPPAARGAGGIWLTERGTAFGYQNLVVDMRSLAVLKGFGYPVVFDATHSVQLPGGAGNASGGQREFIEPLARAAIAVGVDGLFLEVHDRPEKALSDSATQFPLANLPALLERLLRIRAAIQ
jgi:2-dehydro-3-deoxyphosphooctonate aldolase (KDO 8-P synthase)